MKLRDWRLKQELTQAEVGQKLRLSAAQVSRIENGKRTSVDRKFALALFDLTKGAVTADDILEISATHIN